MEYKITPFEALGTTWWITCFQPIKPSIETEIKEMLSIFEHRYSRFLETSYISTLNRDRSISVPNQECAYLIEKGLSYYEISEGVFDFTQGNILKDRGYDSAYSFQETDQAGQPNTSLKELIVYTKDRITLNGVGDIDLGGFGKGYIIDKLAEYMRSQDLHYFMINGGGDIFVTSDNDQPVNIILGHPSKKDLKIGSVSLKNQAICTSSPNLRTWTTAEGNTYNHLISNQQHQPVTSYVITDLAIDADMLATTLSIKHDPEYIKSLQQSIAFGYQLI